MGLGCTPAQSQENALSVGSQRPAERASTWRDYSRWSAPARYSRHRGGVHRRDGTTASIPGEVSEIVEALGSAPSRAWRSLLVVSDGAPAIIRAIEECSPRHASAGWSTGYAIFRSLRRPHLRLPVPLAIGSGPQISASGCSSRAGDLTLARLTRSARPVGFGIGVRRFDVSAVVRPGSGSIQPSTAARNRRVLRASGRGAVQFHRALSPGHTVLIRLAGVLPPPPPVWDRPRGCRARRSLHQFSAARLEQISRSTVGTSPKMRQTALPVHHPRALNLDEAEHVRITRLQ